MQTETRRDRVRARTPARLNAKIDAQTNANIGEATSRGPAAVQRRLQELDREWDIDRSLMLLLSIAGTVAHELGLRSRSRWLHRALRAQLAFLGIYALVGWAPPVPLMRLFGCRTPKEIEHERQALRGLS